MNVESLVEKLIKNNKTISAMESCTGGGFANAITNVSGSSQILKYSAVTYSNEFKIKMGVSKDIIDKHSVYSMETANEMSFNISKFTNSDYGIGITGKLNEVDINNSYGDDNIVFISIYDSKIGKFYNKKVKATMTFRKENKELVIKKIVEKLLEIIEK